jgi:hypothetical protein
MPEKKMWIVQFILCGKKSRNFSREKGPEKLKYKTQDHMGDRSKNSDSI